MTSKEFSGYVGLMQNEYGKAYGLNAARLAFEQIGHCSAKALGRAVDKLMLGATMLPPLQRVIDETLKAERELALDEARRREEEARTEKEEFRRGQAAVFGAKSGMEQKTLLLIRGMLSGRITRAAALEGMRQLDRLYPSAGFATEGQRLAMHYEGAGLDPNGMCGQGKASNMAQDEQNHG